MCNVLAANSECRSLREALWAAPMPPEDGPCQEMCSSSLAQNPGARAPGAEERLGWAPCRVGGQRGKADTLCPGGAAGTACSVASSRPPTVLAWPTSSASQTPASSQSPLTALVTGLNPGPADLHLAARARVRRHRIRVSSVDGEHVIEPLWASSLVHVSRPRAVPRWLLVRRTACTMPSIK